VFRLKLVADSPANVKPLVIKVRDGAEPVRMSARKYALPQLKFMRDKCYALLRMRPLSIPYAECSVVISCGKVDYDKSR
jgi:hypothetical protein